jgi:DNA-binding response OmpR family regulator
MIVLNDPVLLGLVAGSLRPEGHDLIEVSNPMDALRMAVVERQKLDLVVAGVNIQPISGLELARRLARKGINVPMLFMLSSRSVAAVLTEGLGQSAVIEEPFTGAELRTSVRRCLAGKRRRAASE